MAEINSNRLEDEFLDDVKNREAYIIQSQKDNLSKILTKIRISKDMIQEEVANKSGLTDFIKYLNAINIDLPELIEKHYLNRII